MLHLSCRDNGATRWRSLAPRWKMPMRTCHEKSRFKIIFLLAGQKPNTFHPSVTSSSRRERNRSFDCRRASARAEPSASGAVVSEPERATNIKVSALSCSFFFFFGEKQPTSKGRTLQNVGSILSVTLTRSLSLQMMLLYSLKEQYVFTIRPGTVCKPSRGQTLELLSSTQHFVFSELFATSVLFTSSPIPLPA